MAKKKQFDWRTHSKPVRGLSATQEAALVGGELRPLLELALSDASYRLEVRPRSASLYRHGTMLVRITGDGPFVAEVESPGGIERREIATVGQSTGLADELHAMVPSAPNRRAVLHALASVNSGGDLYSDELIVVDTEYNVGQRKVDLVALRRSEGVTGPGGFANPVLVLGDVRCCGQSLTGNAGLASVAADVAEFAKALSGEHLARAHAELVDLVAQKVRIGVLPPELEVRAITDALPELLVLFSDFDVTDPSHDRALIELAEKLAARHYPAGRLTFAHYIETPEPGDHSMALREGEVVGYRDFKAYRQAER